MNHTSDTQLAATLQSAIGAGRVDQVAFLVEDLGVAIGRWSALHRDETWRIYTYGLDNVENLRYHGEPGRFSMRLALIGHSPQIELIQPLAGPSIYHDWIARHGYGLHHFGFFVPSIADAVARFEAAGHPTIQSGSGYGLDGDGGFAYFDFEDIYGIHLEAIEVPARRRPSEPLPEPRD
ncbi:VOC family protein [Micromonospora sp. NPDC092111]|uniref:VOC family protein n=1 Tax=Micromonospora sp. NPDC092111 TaxID=3364289 RepID=UPI00380270FD